MRTLTGTPPFSNACRSQLLLETTACTPRQHAHGRLLAHDVQSRPDTGRPWREGDARTRQAQAHDMQSRGNV